MLQTDVVEKQAIESFFGQLVDQWNLVVRLTEERFEYGVVVGFFDQLSDHWRMFTKLTDQRFSDGLVRFKKKNYPTRAHQALR